MVRKFQPIGSCADEVQRGQCFRACACRVMLSDKLLSKTDYNCDREIRTLELLKLRFGDANLHNCEVGQIHQLCICICQACPTASSSALHPLMSLLVTGLLHMHCAPWILWHFKLKFTDNCAIIKSII